MTCPNCSKPVGEQDQECANCGFILAKWRAAQAAGQAASVAAGTGTAAAGAPPWRSAPPEEGSGINLETLLLFGLFLSVALYYFIFGRGAPEGGRRIAKGTCAISGEVLDIYRLQPAAGVKISLGATAQGVSDAEGKFLVALRPATTYQALLSHAQFVSSPVEGFGRDWREANFEQRVRAARSVLAQAQDGNAAPAPSREFRCEPGEERIYNFALVPLAVGPEEKAQIDAVP